MRTIRKNYAGVNGASDNAAIVSKTRKVLTAPLILEEALKAGLKIIIKSA